MIKGKKIQSASIKTILPLKNIKIMKSQHQQKFLNTSKPMSLKNNVDQQQQKQLFLYQNNKQSRQNIQNLVNQQKIIRRLKGLPNKDQIIATDDQIDGRISKDQARKISKYNTTKSNCYRQVTIKHERSQKLQNNCRRNISKNVGNIKKKTAKSINKYKNQKIQCKDSEIQTQQLKQSKIKVFSEAQSQQMERQSFPTPILADQIQQQLLISKHSSQFDNQQLQQLDFNYSFHGEDAQSNHQTNNLPINMNLFQLTADQILALDYFSI